MLAKSMLVSSLVYHKRQIDVLAPPAGLAMRPVNAAGAPTSGQTGRKEAAGKGLIGTRFCIPRMRGPEPRQSAVVPGPPDPVPSAHRK